MIDCRARCFRVLSRDGQESEAIVDVIKGVSQFTVCRVCREGKAVSVGRQVSDRSSIRDLGGQKPAYTCMQRDIQIKGHGIQRMQENLRDLTTERIISRTR